MTEKSLHFKFSFFFECHAKLVLISAYFSTSGF
jgi:hypothetical protein